MSTTFTPEKQEQFFAALRNTCNVSRSCEFVGISSSTAYNMKRDFPSFAERWQEAIEYAADTLEESARERALGVQDAIYHQGVIVGYKTVYSDAMTALLLRAHRPQKFRDNSSVEMSGKDGGPIIMSDVEKAAKINAILEAAKQRKAEAENDDLA
jgi:hypothetical protein